MLYLHRTRIEKGGRWIEREWERPKGSTMTLCVCVCVCVCYSMFVCAQTTLSHCWQAYCAVIAIPNRDKQDHNTPGSLNAFTTVSQSLARVSMGLYTVAVCVAKLYVVK